MLQAMPAAGKCTPDVFSPLRGVQPELGPGFPGPCQHGMFYRNFEHSAQLACQHVRLVERPRKQAVAMKRHRHNSLWQGSTPVMNGFQQFPAQDLPASQVAIVFELAYELICG
jgi:hypothetical protein